METAIELLSANAELLEILIMRDVGIHRGADDLLRLGAVLFRPLLILRLDRRLFLQYGVRAAGGYAALRRT